MKRKLASILSIIIFSILFIGCFNYIEIIKNTFSYLFLSNISEFVNVHLFKFVSAA